MAIIYHGTPITPRDALLSVMPGRAACVSYYRPDSVADILAVCPNVMLDNGAFSEWRAAQRRGEDWFFRDDWRPYYDWLEDKIFTPAVGQLFQTRPARLHS